MGAAEALADCLIKMAGGFILGFAVRDVIARRGPKPVLKATKKVVTVTTSKPAPAPARVSVPRPKEELKMVLCVNQSLKMGTGKVGAQCAHAACGVLQEHHTSHEVAIKQWGMLGQAKIALKIQDEHEMRELQKTARELGLPTYIVHDAGRTQIAAGSQTVLAIGPGPKSQIDVVTGHLKLL